MRIAIVGQRDFGKGVLDAFLARGDSVAGIFCAPEKPGSAPDPLRIAGQEHKIPVYQLASLKDGAALQALRALDVDIGIMAYVLQFVPQEFVSIPRLGMIQFHPSLLPRYRGPSSINWPVIRGDTTTGLTIFRPTDGLDEGPILLQKETPIGPNDTVGSVYFDRLFPMGIAALVEAADLVASGRAVERSQVESDASYEGWCREAEAQVNWHHPVDWIHNLIRGCSPAPGAWTLFAGKRLQLFDTQRHLTRTFSQVRGKIGAITQVGERSVFIAAQGGEIEASKLRYDNGKKLAAVQLCADLNLHVGIILGA
jgi:methionyl-tRNA formyltransferase